jgi:tetratricopeptide (TPR) repeat protein
MDPGVGLFIRRAAVLHTDAAIFAERFHVTPDAGPSPPPMPSGRRRTDPVSPLLWSDSVVMHSDGRIIGEMPANWNWPFARSLVGLLLPASGTGLGTADDRAFVGAWYHAVDAYLMATGNLAELAPHLRQAAAVLPDDPHVLFDRACYAETLGLAYNQAVRDEPGLWDARSGAGVRLPSEEATNDDAERLFRRAIDADPGYAEARVRLARLLELRGRHDEAAGAIETALAQASERHVVFYARLVAGRIAQARGRAGEAVDQYAEASTLFPDAQSAMVGASQAAFMNADVTAALTFVQKLGPGSEPFDADPWRIYKLGAGRDADALVGAIWARMKARPAVDRGIVK